MRESDMDRETKKQVEQLEQSYQAVDSRKRLDNLPEYLRRRVGIFKQGNGDNINAGDSYVILDQRNGYSFMDGAKLTDEEYALINECVDVAIVVKYTEGWQGMGGARPTLQQEIEEQRQEAPG